MEYVNSWIGSLAAYFLMISVLDQLLPGRKYAKYIRLFGGMVLILLVLTPVSRGLRLEDTIARYYREFSFRNDAGELKQEMLGIEKQQLSEMIRQYEESIASDIRRMAEEEALEVISCHVSICKEREDERFGQILSVELVYGKQPSFEKKGKAESGIEPVRPVVIGADDIVSPKEEKTADRLREKIVSHYELEESYVEIQIVERKG